MSPSAYLVTWKYGTYSPGVYMPDEIGRVREQYGDDVNIAPLFTYAQIGESIMHLLPQTS